MSDENIVRYTRDNLPEGQTDWERLARMTEEEIEANAESDPDNPPWTAEDFRNAELVMPGEGPKVPTSIRLDQEVVDFFKRQGRGYQTRMNAVLLAYVRAQARRAG